MAETRPIRHQIDFQLIPALYHKDPKAFAGTFTLTSGELLAKIYTDVYKEIKPRHFWQKRRQFSKEDFKVQKEQYPDGVRIFYVTLPPADDGSHVYCTAYALVIGDGETKFYTIEKSVFGTTCIGTVDKDGHHINLGVAGHSVEENMKILHGFEETEEEEPTVEVQKTVHPDGSYVEAKTDHRNNRAEINEYDAQGNRLRSANGTFLDEREIADIDDIFDFLEEHEDDDEDDEKDDEEDGDEDDEKDDEEDGDEEGFLGWEPKNIMGEVRMMVMSCSSPPIAGTPEENARRVMEKIEYFRDNGVQERDLYELESKILLFMPDFVVKNFEEFYVFLKEDISSIYITMELLIAKGDYVAAKKIADPLAAYLDRHKSNLIDGHHCHQDPFETALYTLEAQQAVPTKSTKDNYTAFLVAYARILQNTKIIRHNQEIFRMAESRKYLKWAQELSPQNASVWLYLGVSYNDNEEQQLEYYRKALQYCYLKDGDYGLTKIYECLAMHYWSKDQIDVVVALKELIAALGGNPFMLTFLLSKRNAPASRPLRDVLREHDIQIGFSDLVLQTAEFLEDPRAHMRYNRQVQALLQEIRTVNL